VAVYSDGVDVEDGQELIGPVLRARLPVERQRGSQPRAARMLSYRRSGRRRQRQITAREPRPLPLTMDVRAPGQIRRYRIRLISR
jgi:hypothetical protein